MPDTLSQRLQSLVTSLPTAVPESEPPTDFLARRPDTAALPASPRSVLAPGAAPIACIQPALPASNGPEPPELLPIDLERALRGNAAQPVHPKPPLALPGSACLQTGAGRCCRHRRGTHHVDQSSADAERRRNSRSARSPEVRLVLCVARRAIPLDNSIDSRVTVPDGPDILPR